MVESHVQRGAERRRWVIHPGGSLGLRERRRQQIPLLLHSLSSAFVARNINEQFILFFFFLFCWELSPINPKFVQMKEGEEHAGLPAQTQL